MRRAFMVLGMALLLSLAVSGTASAAVSSLTLNPKATLTNGNTTAIASGTIVCDQGDTVDVTVVFTQTGSKANTAGTGDTLVSCSGQVQAWSAPVNVVIGTSFKHGPADAIVSAFDQTDSTNSATVIQGVKL